MKKLLTFLFAVSLSITTFGTVYTWDHATFPAAGTWQNSSSWLPAAPASGPGAGDEAYFIMDVDLTVTFMGDVNVEHLFIERKALGVVNRTLTFKSNIDGYTLTFTNVSVLPHSWDVGVGVRTTLNCNTSSHRLKIVCTPSVRFLCECNLAGTAKGIFIPAIYEPCTDGKGFVLQASSTQHAEFIQQRSNTSVVRGWQDFAWSVNKYHYVCAPVETDQVTILPPTYPGPPEDLACWKANCLCVFAGNNVRPYDIGTQDWGSWYTGWAPCDVTLSPDAAFTLGKGYLIYGHGGYNTPSIYGDFHSGGYDLPISANANEWSLVGNPFPSGIRFIWNDGSGSPIGMDWAPANVDPWVAYWSNVPGNVFPYSSPMTYYYNFYTNPPTAIPPQGATNPAPNEIARSQGFFVHTKVAGASLSMDNEARQFVPDKQIGKAVETATNRLYLKLEDGGVNAPDYTVITFSDKGETNYCSQDILKMFANDVQKSEIYCIKADNQKVVSNTLPIANGNISVPVYMNVGNSGTYTITAEELGSFGSNVGIVLKDNKTNTTVDLRTVSSYSFTAQSGDDAGRFMLFFTDVLGINNLTDIGIKVYSNGNSIYILNNNSNLKGSVTVYDIVGKELMNVNLTNDLVTKLTSNFDRGYYVVSIMTDKGLVTQKVYLN